MATIQEELQKFQNGGHSAVYWIHSSSHNTSCRTASTCFSYCSLVDGALALRTVPLTAAVQSLSSGSGPAVARPRAGGDRVRDARSDPSAVTGGALQQSLSSSGYQSLPGQKGIAPMGTPAARYALVERERRDTAESPDPPLPVPLGI